MKRLTRPPKRVSTNFTADLGRLILAAERLGYIVNGANMEEAYSEWSEENYCAGWLTVPENDRDLIPIICKLVSDGHLVEY